MSWHTGSLLSTREQFALAALQKRESFVQLCHHFRIARSTGLGVVERAAAETAALHRLQNDLGNTPLTLPPDSLSPPERGEGWI